MAPLNTDDPAFMPLTALSQAIGAGTISSVELVDRLLTRIDAHDDKLHAFVTVYGDDARLAAEGADKAIRSGHKIGPLHGIPIAIKDIVDIKGRITTPRLW
jgi:aspartyl-tRNA(Asn)/glutamyl-tRNA(Gln) amidotransferase subunit A